MQQVELTWGVATHTGRRPENQDRCLAAPPVFAVADGMGGHAAGAAASEAVIACLAATADGPTVDVAALRTALRRADEHIRALREPDGTPSGAGTTVAGLALVENSGALYWAAFHIGDSRVYRWSAGGWERISTDHSVVQELLDDGAISPTEALSHPQRHVITRAVGVGAPAEADFSLLPVNRGERLLLCSDGLTARLDDDHLTEVLAAVDDATVAADRLVAEAVDAGGEDNVSAVVVHVHGLVAGGDDESEDVTIPRVPAVETSESGA